MLFKLFAERSEKDKMESVIVSIKPEWIEKIASGEKTMIKFANAPKGTPPIFHKELKDTNN